jgi:hypothetical protein
VTLYEVPKESIERVETEKPKQEPAPKTDAVAVAMAMPPVNGKPVPQSRRTRPANGRSKSEPSLECKLYIPSPDSDGQQPGLEALASPSRNGSRHDDPPPLDEDLYKI